MTFLLLIILHLLPLPQQYTGCTVVFNNGAVTISCPAPAPPLSIVTPVALPPATVGVPYSANLSSLVQPAGGVAPYTFKPVDGFPAWSRLSPAGILTGTPLAPCSCILKFNVSDSSGQSLPASSLTRSPKEGVIFNVSFPPADPKDLDPNAIVTGASR